MIIFLYYKIFIKKKNLSWKKKKGRFSPTILLYPSPKAFPSCCSNLAPKTGDLIIQMLPDKQIFTFNLFILMIAFFWRILSLSFSFLFCLITKLHTQHKRLWLSWGLSIHDRESRWRNKTRQETETDKLSITTQERQLGYRLYRGANTPPYNQNISQVQHYAGSQNKTSTVIIKERIQSPLGWSFYLKLYWPQSGM